LASLIEADRSGHPAQSLLLAAIFFFRCHFPKFQFLKFNMAGLFQVVSISLFAPLPILDIKV